MRYDKSSGIGRNAKGPTKLIEESKQKGQRGLGFVLEEFTDVTAEWDFDDDPVNISFFFFSFSFIFYYRLQLKKKFIGVHLVIILKLR
jgi:hypothetical protein